MSWQKAKDIPAFTLLSKLATLYLKMTELHALKQVMRAKQQARMLQHGYPRKSK